MVISSRGASNVNRTRNAEYLQISMAIDELLLLQEALRNLGTQPIHICRLNRALEYLEERKITVAPTGAKNRPSPR